MDLATILVTVSVAFGAILVERFFTNHQERRRFLREERLRLYYQFDEVVSRFTDVIVVGEDLYVESDAFRRWMVDLKVAADRIRLLAPHDVARSSEAVWEEIAEMGKSDLERHPFANPSMAQVRQT